MLDLSVKESFFDRERVQRAVDRGRRIALNRIGGFLRTTTRRSMRRRAGPSEPGKPPHAHVGLLRDQLFYSYDQVADSVVVGPALLRHKGQDGAPVNATIPQVLEEGGRIQVREVKRGDSWKRAKTSRAAAGGVTRTTEVPVAARPSIGPALETARKADKLAPFWKDVVR